MSSAKIRGEVFIANMQKYAEEMMGALSLQDSCAFSLASIQALESKKRFLLSDIAPETELSNVIVYHYIDPHGGMTIKTRRRE